MSKIKVLIADDHNVLLQGLTQLLDGQENIEISHTAENGLEVLSYLKNETVDVILMDINMPVLNGLDTCKKVNQKYPDVKVIALSTLDRGSFIQQMLKNGASGYLLKNTSRDELIEAIKTVHKGATYLNKETNDILLKSLMNNGSEKTFIPSLTRREKEVLELIVKEHTTAEISEQLHISQNTVETHRRHLIQKFNVRNSVGLVKEAMLKGFVGS